MENRLPENAEDVVGDNDVPTYAILRPIEVARTVQMEFDEHIAASQENALVAPQVAEPEGRQTPSPVPHSVYGSGLLTSVSATELTQKGHFAQFEENSWDRAKSENANRSLWHLFFLRVFGQQYVKVIFSAVKYLRLTFFRTVVFLF